MCAHRGLAYYASQSWSSNFLGLTWSTDVYNFLLADFNADGIGDIFMQSNQPGVSHLGKGLFTLSPQVAYKYAYFYGNGVFVINTRVSAFTSLVASGQIIVDPGEIDSFSVMPSGLGAFTSASQIIYVPAESQRFYDEIYNRPK